MATNAPARPPAGSPPAAQQESTPAEPRSSLFQRHIPLRAVATFARQLAVLLDAGIPMVRALKVLGRRTSGGGMRELLAGVTADVEAGGSFATALQTHGEGLPGIVVPLCRAGEKAGELSKNLRYLADSLDHDAHVRGKVTNALLFPAITTLVAIAALLVLLLYVAPVFKNMLQEGDPSRAMPEVPWLSEVVFAASDVARSGAGIAIIVIGIAALAFGTWKSLTHKSYFMDFLKIRIPFIGNMVVTAAVARFAKTLAALLRTGVPVLESLKLARATVDNMALEQAILAMEKSVENGGRMSAPLEEYWYVPELARDMIVIGEESGSMAEMLENLSDVFRVEVEQQQDRLVTVIEPIATLCMGLFVLLVLLSMFLPYLTLVTRAVPG
jgi:type II secretory pathway component PulF